MQKIFSPVLNNFIQEFKLAGANGTIIFDAMVEFKTDLKSTEVPSAVHLIALENQQMNVFYFLHSEDGENQSPEMLPVSEDADIKQAGKSLIIRSYSQILGKFTVSIHARV